MKYFLSQNTPLEVYHGVPEGWTKAELISLYNSLGGINSIDSQEATEPGAPYWLPDRYNWLQYRHTLYYVVAKGVQNGDPACIEIAIRYIELNYCGSYSGFIRSKLAKGLKNQTLTKAQKIRLIQHFKTLIRNKLCLEEFREYNRLRKKIMSSWS